jgi:transposase InsO family protein
MKTSILSVIEEAVSKGVHQYRACELVQIDVRRVQRWQTRDGRLDDIVPGPDHAPHALLEREREAIREMALDEKYVDDSHRILTAKAADSGLFYASASTVYRVMRQKNLTTDRCNRSHRNGKSMKPERLELTGPKQRWCWDISYCQTKVKGVFLYLFVMLDEYSRKVVAWRISWNMTYKEAMELLQEGLENENLTDIDVRLPDLINDRGTQMKAKAFMKMCTTLGINQKFARPRTPNDNPFIESFFSTVKGHQTYPGYFTDDIEAIVWFTEFFNFYNNERYHGKINFVTPVQKHEGRDIAIIERRIKGNKFARKTRMEQNRKTTPIQKVASGATRSLILSERRH